MISANYDKFEGLFAKWWNQYKGNCFSIVESFFAFTHQNHLNSIFLWTHRCQNKQTNLQVAKILLVPPKFELIMVLSNCFFQYCESNIGLFSIACHKVIALPSLQYQKLLLLTSLLNFCIGFERLFMTSFLYYLPYSYCSSDYCESNSCHSFSLIRP